MLYDSDKSFKILSIDGGGIRGIYPAKFLSELEYQLKQEGKETKINKYFDLICGTSTGGIIALGLALGMPASEILDLYKINAGTIFGDKNGCIASLTKPFYSSRKLKELLKKKFSHYSEQEVTRLGHAKTRVCIPVYNSGKGRISVYKTSHHPELKTDYQYPAHDVALSTSSAPFYFKPHSFTYTRADKNQSENITNNIDGGIFANNPTLIGITEAIEALEVPTEKVKVLSIGTGNKAFCETDTSKGWGTFYWGAPPAPKIIDLMMSAQSDYINNIVKFLNKGIGNNGSPQFLYERIQFKFENIPPIDLDDTDKRNLKFLEDKAFDDFQVKGSKVVNDFCKTEVTPYTPICSL